MLSQRLFAIVVGTLMITSIIGFAVSSLTQLPKQQEFKMPSVVNRLLSPEEKVQVIRSGKVLIEYLYPEGCRDCIQKNQTYAEFVNKFKNYAILETAGVPQNQTLNRMIGINGNTQELDNITSSGQLLRIFCSLAIIQPKQCILLEI